MYGYVKELLQKLFHKEWKKIFREWLWILRYVKRYRWQITVYAVLGLMGTAFGLISSVVSKNLIDAVTGFNTDSIGWAMSAYVGLGVGRVFINLVTGKISLVIQNKVANEISAEIFDQAIYTEWEAISAYSTGDLLVRLSGDTATISSNVLSFIPSALNALVNFGGAFIIICYHDPWMALLALAGAPVTVLTSRYRLDKMKSFQKESQKMSSKRMTFNQEAFQNIQSIKAFGLLGVFSERMKALQDEALDLSIRQYHYQAWSTVLMSLTSLAVSYGCYGFAVFRLWQGSISYGTMTLFVSMASSLTGSFSSVVQLVPTAIRTAISAERIMEIVELPRERYEDEAMAERIYERGKKSGAFVRLEDVSFHYLDGRPVYEHSSLAANPGEIVALIGPSGQGKTTTLRLLLGLLTPESGRMVVGNPQGDALSVTPSTRRLFSYVPQGNTMFFGTIADNLRLVKREAEDAELEEALKAACAWEFVSKLDEGMYTQVGERGLGFSEGQNQRLSIARALLADAPILLLDEATSALDVATERKVLRQIMKKDPHRTIIVTAHRPSVFSMCSRIYKIQEGSIQEVDEAGIEQFLAEF